MPVRKIIPDSYTDYEDGHLGVLPASLANVEAKIGAAQSGQPFKVYTLSGPDAKKQAKTIFQGGPLLKAIEEAFDAGSTRIHAVRIGAGERASYTAKSFTGQDTLRLLGGTGLAANNHFVNVAQEFLQIIPGYTLAVQNPNRVLYYNDGFNQTREVVLGPEIAEVVGIEPDFLSLILNAAAGCWILGYGPLPDARPMLWRLSQDGSLDGTRTLDLTPFLDAGETLSGLGGMMQGMEDDCSVVTSRRLLFFRRIDSSWTLMDSWDVSLLGVANPDMSSACRWMDMKAMMRGEPVIERTLFLDRTTRRIWILDQNHDGNPMLQGSVDLSSYIEAGQAEGMAIDLDSMSVLVVDRGHPGGNGVLLRLAIDWNAQPGPLVTGVETWALPEGCVGLGSYMADAILRTRLTVQNRTVLPPTIHQYEATGGFFDATSALVTVINQGGQYEANVQASPALWLMPTLDSDGDMPDPLRFEPMTGGADGGDPTNGDYLTGLAATVSKTDTNWIHAVGANTNALWTAVLQHCREMAELHQAERFAILETPEFTSSHDEGSAGYLTDLQDYVDGIVTMMALAGDKNAVIFAGGAQFMDSDGNEYVHPVTACCGGVMAGLDVQKSLINKPVSNILKLVPEFSPGHIETLIQNRANCVRFKPGRGFIIAHSLTAAAEGSDYSRVNDLRAVFYGAKAAREAGQPYVGEENDAAGEGLRRLESAMARPLEQMRDAGQIDGFELSAVSTAADRLLGDVYVSLGIQPRRAMEMIYTTVYLR